jgi:hypothetical protein
MTTSNAEREKVLLAVSGWMRLHFKSFKPNIEMFAAQLIESKAIDSVNRFEELVASGEIAAFAEAYFDGLMSALDSISSNRKLQGTEEL